MAKKIQFGLSNVYFAKATIADDGSATFADPKRWPGAVNLSLDEEGEITKFYADNIVYWQGKSNDGYSGSLESALIPEDFKTDILGEIKDSNNVLYEDADSNGSPFALLFQFENDSSNTRYVLYNCVASRPSVEGKTKEGSVDPQTQTVDIQAASIYVAALGKNIVKSNTTERTTAEEANKWYQAVYVPSAENDSEGA